MPEASPVYNRVHLKVNAPAPFSQTATMVVSDAVTGLQLIKFEFTAEELQKACAGYHSDSKQSYGGMVTLDAKLVP